MDRGQLEFVSFTGLTFGLIGLAVFGLFVLNFYILYKIIQHVNNLTRINRAKRDIEERERHNIARRIREKESQEYWQRFLAGLDEEDNI
jgi:hypothetical protein